MKTKHLKIGIAFVTASLTSVLFNNFSFTQWQRPEVPAIESVNEASRVSHAKELLGGGYKGSDAQKIEGQKALNQAILSKVQSQLPAKFKGQARAIARTVISESAKYGMDPVFVLAVIKTESKFNPLVVGRHGEIGLMQIKPDTAEWIAKKFDLPFNGKKTLQSPSANIKIGMAYMNYLRAKFDKKAMKYVSAYNMGPTNVRRLLAKNVKPAEYNSRVMKNYSVLYSNINSKNPHTLAAL
ncbi:lytic transglycosylase domain-containing protein [Bdellovibrio bacteriovorus]|uniref:Soluble lytic murein transglycosylase n=1 Tax=Bdellovibrio bacteriovorus str. Tiberius TaxID=1069642 RepID=K7ZG29_BDEBC|nr:lytic transglycosylase domain-containing protein [Bdellovibrio bacteriovorus]AFY02087.1 soluble lytic murein transglycosylase [Bdellovibrio bacteriovorus str. Tiberius]